MTERLELKFSLTEEDLIQFQEFRESKTPQPKFDLSTLKTSLLISLMIAAMWFFTTKRSLPESILISLIFTATITLAFFLFTRIIRNQGLGQSQRCDLQGLDEVETTLNLTDRDLTISGVGGEQTVSLYSFQQVAEYRHGYVFLSHEDKIEVMIPKRIFQDYDTERRFRELVETRPGLNF